ncbi:hypothetical protein FWF89_00380 [Candidatus Saccharibacteria bacterium]|nr:hypothetical protein [Candidatus Saccharibacteria bacterium]
MTNQDITNDALEAIGARIKADARYGEEGGIVGLALRTYPENTDSSIVAMKIALIDMTNSTQLSRLLGEKVVTKKNAQTGKREVVSRTKKSITLGKIVEKIRTVDFDERVKRGDKSLVSELARWGYMDGTGVNLFSFFSKYCCYHNELIYGGDDYSIFDSVIKNYLGNYMSVEEYEEIFGTKLVLRSNQTIAGVVCNKIERMRTSFDYESYADMIDKFLTIKGITCEKKRRKLDWKIWYDNRA